MVIACQPWLNQPASRNLMSDDNDNWFRFTPHKKCTQCKTMKENKESLRPFHVIWGNLR